MSATLSPDKKVVVDDFVKPQSMFLCVQYQRFFNSSEHGNNGTVTHRERPWLWQLNFGKVRLRSGNYCETLG